jgi:superfamily II DNA or RNA helicase
VTSTGADLQIAAAVDLFGAGLPPSRPTLRPYQTEAVDRLRDALAAGRKPLLVMPTGAGKTIVFTNLIDQLVAVGKRVLVLVPRRELVHQTCRKLDDISLEHGGLLAGADERAGVGAAVVVATPSASSRTART